MEAERKRRGERGQAAVRVQPRPESAPPAAIRAVVAEPLPAPVGFRSERAGRTGHRLCSGRGSPTPGPVVAGGWQWPRQVPGRGNIPPPHVRAGGGAGGACRLLTATQGNLATCRIVAPPNYYPPQKLSRKTRCAAFHGLPLRHLPTRCCEVAGRCARAPRMGFGPFRSLKPARTSLCAASAVPGCRGSA